MHNQKFWAIVNRTTGKIAKGIAYEYKIYSSREQARKMNICMHKKQAGNYKIVSLWIEAKVAVW